MSISDTMFHIQEDLSPDARGHLETELRSLGGVIAPRFNPEKPHLLKVVFDTEAVCISDMRTWLSEKKLTLRIVAI